MARPPVVLQTDVHCFKCARKIRKAVENLLGVERVWASPDTGLVVVAGTADALALRRRIRQKMRRPVAILSDGSAPYAGATTPHWPYGTGPSALSSLPSYGWGTAPSYGWGTAPSYGWGTAPPPYAYYSHPPPPPAEYPYGGWVADHDPYGYGTRATVPTCTIL